MSKPAYKFTDKEMGMIIYCIEEKRFDLLSANLRERFRLYCNDYGFDNPVEEHYAAA